jgi:two-component system sensor histidine kinase UhpB
MAAGHSQGTENRLSRSMDGVFPDLLSIENAPVAQPLNVTWVRELRNVLIGTAGIVLSYKYGSSGNPGLLSALWLPDSVLLCCLLFTPVRRWWIYLLLAFPIRMHYGTLSGFPEWQLLANYPNDMFKAVVSASLLRVFSRGRFRLDTLYQFRLFFIIAVVLSPILSAFGGAAVRHLAGYPFWQVWYRWYLSCALTALSITPSLIYWITSPPQALRTTTRRYIEAFLLSCGVVLTSYAAFARVPDGVSTSVVLLYAPIPFLIWAAARFGPLAASTAISVVGILAMLSTRYGRGPFVVSSAAENVVAMQLFLVVIAIPLLLLSILITERRRTEDSLRDAMQALARSREHLRENYDHIQNLSNKLLSLHEEERKAISRELHNGVSQQITGVLLSLTSLKRQAGIPANARRELDSVLPRLSEVSDGIRNLSRQLHPSVVESMGLPRALQSLCNDARMLHGLEAEFRGCEVPAELSSNSALVLYHIAQEAVRNAAYHSRSKRARIELSSSNRHLCLSVRDWGCGFDVERARRKGGLGLISMQDRARSVDAMLKVNSRSGDGTEIVVELPVRPPELSGNQATFAPTGR